MTKYMTIHLVFFALLIGALMLPAPSLASHRHREGENENSIIVRVHITSTDSAKIGTSGGCRLIVSDGEGRRKIAEAPAGTVFSLKEGKFQAGEKSTGEESLSIRPEHGQELLVINGRSYHGTMVLSRKKPASFIIVNHVDLEDYLAGVLGGEVSATWPMDSLKAQAVAARSYVMYKKKLPRDVDFDVYSTVMDQMYVGVSQDPPRLAEAITGTRGEVLTYNNNVIKAYFYSTCGGHTEDGSEVFPDDGAFIKGVPCPYCKSSPGFAWEKKLTSGEIEKVLAKNGIITGELCDIKITRTNRTGRIADVVIVTTDGEKTIRGCDLRMLIGPGLLRSTKLKMTMLESKKETLPAGEKIHFYTAPAHLAFPGSDSLNEMLSLTVFGPLAPTLEMPLTSEMTAPQSTDGALPIMERMHFLVSTPGEEKQKFTATYLFTGEGWGHGVGMCQWGAYAMAGQGMSYRQILQFYYPGTAIVKASNGK